MSGLDRAPGPAELNRRGEGAAETPPLLASPPPVGAFSGRVREPCFAEPDSLEPDPPARSGRPPSRSGWNRSRFWAPQVAEALLKPQICFAEPDSRSQTPCQEWPTPFQEWLEPVKVLGPPVAEALLKPQIQPLLKIEATGSPGPGHPSPEMADENIVRKEPFPFPQHFSAPKQRVPRMALAWPRPHRGPPKAWPPSQAGQ